MSAPLTIEKSGKKGDTRPKREVADILRMYLPSYLRNHKLSARQFKIVKAILSCRTSALGGHIRECDNGDCGNEDQSYNSCGDRHCPKCQGVARNKWLRKRLKEVLPVPYYHVVFTIPHLLNNLALYNRKLFYDILFEASSQTLKELSSNPDYLGAIMGFLGILHTWGQTMVNHFHIHYIVPG
ncbi:transposase zinc-binding domain-containing protein, partial [bacterium]|nr:transposase zinc-binding domain-containing protein [bacterium]